MTVWGVMVGKLEPGDIVIEASPRVLPVWRVRERGRLIGGWAGFLIEETS